MNNTIIDVSGDECRTAFLIKGTENILYDTGMAYCAPVMIENLKRELSGAPLHAVLLSHSHYDHVAGLPFLKTEWPKLTVYGSPHAKEILEKPSARATIRRLSDAAARGAGLSGAPEYDETLLSVDVTVRDGDRIVIGGHTVTVYETPGHTRCSVSYLLDQDVLFASETVGVFTKECYMPCYLVGYQMSLDAVEKLRKAPAKRLFISHRGILAGQEPGPVWDYLEREIRRTKEEIVAVIRENKTEKEQLDTMLSLYHAGVSQNAQPDFAFLLNAAATLKIVKEECMEAVG